MKVEKKIMDHMKGKFIVDINKITGTAITFDSIGRDLILFNLKRQLHFKYSDLSECRYQFNFTESLLSELSKSEKSKMKNYEYCIVLFCRDSENFCILKYKELLDFCSDLGELSLTIKEEERSFILSSSNHKKRVSKKSILPKILGK